MLALLADGPFWGYSLGQLAIGIIVIAAVVAVVYVALREFGIVIPSFVVRIFWIFAAAVIAVVAVKLLLSLT